MNSIEKYTDRLPIPRIKIIPMDAVINPTEESLRCFFKCTFNIIEAENMPCYAVRHTSYEFMEHLETMHPSPKQTYCCYCYHYNNEENILLTHEQLINHIKNLHKFRRYQCNKCIFRAITPEQVNIHQRFIHLKTFNATIFNDFNIKNRCNILECPPFDNVDVPLPTDEFYLSKAHPRLNLFEPNDTFYQCLFCNFMNDEKFIVAGHCSQKHPDYPIMFYKPEPSVTSTTQ